MKLRLISLALAAVMLCLTFSGCNSKTNDNVPDIPDEQPYGTDISQYTIVRSENASKELSRYVAMFQQQMLRYTKADLAVSEDTIEDGQSTDLLKEILIGETNREESAQITKLLEKAPDNGYVIKATENKIIISGKTDAATVRAMKYFLMNYAAEADVDNYLSIVAGDTKSGTVDLDSIIFNNYTELITESRSTVYAPEDEWKTGNMQYPTMVRLYHNGEMNGTLIATCESAEKGYAILRSTDDGATWEKITYAKDELNVGYTCNWMPSLFELPVDMGEYKAGTVILAGTSRNTWENFSKSTITLYASTDAGETWTAFSNVDYGGAIGLGVWEPFLIYEEDRNRLYCFYSDDSDPEHSQKLVYKYTTDLENWIGANNAVGADADPKEAVACADPDLRPGMTSITKMGNGKYIMTYEMVGISHNPVYAKTTEDLDDWGDVVDYGNPVKNANGISFGSAPWCAWTPEGGECGTLVVVGKHPIPIAPIHSEGAKMMISLDYGETFIAIDNPIPAPIPANLYVGYSPYLVFSEDGRTLYYLNNPAFGHGFCEHIVLAKIKIW